MTSEELKKMTKAELLELARTNNLRVTSQMAKSDLIEALAAAEKRKKAPLAAKPKPKPKKVATSPDQRRMEAAKKAARKFIAGVREKPRAAKKPRVEEAPPRAAAQLPVAKPSTTKPAAVKPAPTKPAPPKPTPPKPAEFKSYPVKPAETRPLVSKPIETRPSAPPKPAPEPERLKKGAKAARKKPAPRKPAVEAAKGSDEAIRQLAEEGKFYLGHEQRAMPPVEAIDIPKGYNVDRIVAMVRDPYWVFAYWEITDHKYRELERAFGDAWSKCKMILRIYDRTTEKTVHFDIILTREARSWYVNVSSERRYQIAIGALSTDGRFELVAISNIVETPSGKVSDRIDEHWMVPDDVFNQIFAASGGYDMHSASGELKGLLEKHLLEQLSSGAVSSFGSGALYEKAKGRAFRLWVATELILYGGTEPDARVTVQGKDVKLRPDGTFSLRFALPDGKIDLPVTAVSGDGLEERTIETGVTKKSAKKAPVLK